MEELEICSLCGEGKLSQQVKLMTYTYRGRTIDIDQPGMYCDSCDESILGPKDLKATRKELTAFKEWVTDDIPKEVEFNFCIFSENDDITDCQSEELMTLITDWAESNDVSVGGGYNFPLPEDFIQECELAQSEVDAGKVTKYARRNK